MKQGVKIYFAGPLHKQEDQQYNIMAVKLLRGTGASVYLPQEHGIVFDGEQKGASWDAADRQAVFLADIKEIQNAQLIVASTNGRKMSTGMVWELGYAAALKKRILVVGIPVYDLLIEQTMHYARTWIEALEYVHSFA